MEIRVAIVDPLPLFSHGAVAALHDAGFAVDQPADIWSWLTDADRHIVILSLCASADWQLLADVHAARPDVHLLALISESTPETYVRALAAGAVGVIPRAGSPDSLREAFSSLAKGQTLLPVEVIAPLAGNWPHMRETPVSSDRPRSEMTPAWSPSPQERDWLGQLAAGATVAQLARAAGYSERMMFRLLRSLYSKMGASSRTEALIRARDHGWV